MVHKYNTPVEVKFWAITVDSGQTKIGLIYMINNAERCVIHVLHLVANPTVEPTLYMVRKFILSILDFQKARSIYGFHSNPGIL